MTPSDDRRPRPAITLLWTVLAAVAALVAATLMTSTSAQAGTVRPALSSPGGPISQAEVLARMKNWYDRKIPYSQSHYAWDKEHSREYRTDCSGFADMALHLKYDWNTSSLPTSNSMTRIHDMNHDNRSWFTPAHIQTGDVFDDTTDGHAWVFASWASDGKHFNYYNFGGGSSGTAPPEYHTGALMTASELGYENANNYFVLRFDNIEYEPKPDGPPSS